MSMLEVLLAMSILVITGLSVWAVCTYNALMESEKELKWEKEVSAQRDRAIAQRDNKMAALAAQLDEMSKRAGALARNNYERDNRIIGFLRTLLTEQGNCNAN